MNDKILIVEDDRAFAESLKIRIEESDLSASVEIGDFESSLQQLQKIAPDVVVLDIFQGKPQYDQREGLPIWKIVWEQSFVPLIFISAARVNELIEKTEGHPLLQYVVKTEPTAMTDIVESIRRFVPFGKGIKRIKEKLCCLAEESAQKALTETAPHTLQRGLGPEEGLSLLLSTARRRISAQMRWLSEQERPRLFAWEQYIFPPPEVPYLLTGDILVASNKNDQAIPDAFRVVLSPSCDLAQAKVDYALVGKCVPMEEFYNKNNLPPLTSKGNADKAKSKLSSILTQAQSNGHVVLPGYSDLVPPMAVSLRKMELLSIGQDHITATSVDGKKFARVASMDSPFREQLTWAYLQIACRPGLPDRDLDKWIEEILNELSAQRGRQDD